MSTPSSESDDAQHDPMSEWTQPGHLKQRTDPSSRTLQPQSVFNDNGRPSHLPLPVHDLSATQQPHPPPLRRRQGSGGSTGRSTGRSVTSLPRVRSGKNRNLSIYSSLTDGSLNSGGGSDDEDWAPVHLSTFAPSVAENDIENLASIPILQFLDAHRQPCAIIPLPTHVSSAHSTSSTGSMEPLAETIWANLTFFSVTRGRQLVQCLEPEEAAAFTRWIYGSEFFANGPSGATGGPSDLGYYQGVDLALSPTLTVTLHAGTSAPTTLELCRTISPSTPHLILTSHIISNRPNIISYASKLRAGSAPAASRPSSLGAARPTAPVVGPFGSSIAEATSPVDTAAPLIHQVAATSDLTPTIELERRASVNGSASPTSSHSFSRRGSAESGGRSVPGSPLEPPTLKENGSFGSSSSKTASPPAAEPRITFPEGIPARHPLPAINANDPDLPNFATRTDPEMDAMRREFDRLYEIRMQEGTLLMEWAPVGMFCGTPDGLLTYVNKQFRELTNLHASPNDWPSIFVPADRTPLRHMWEECFRTGKQGSGEFQLMVGEGDAFAPGRSAHHVLVRLVGLTEGRGNSNSNPFVTGFVGTMIDISDRKDYETAQKRMTAERIDAWKARVDETEKRRIEVEESKKQQELLIDITSHEIRNPTSAIIAATDLLRSNINDMLSKVTIGSDLLFTAESVATLEDDILVLDSIHQSATIQERLSNDILRLAQIDLELLQVFPMEFNFVSETRRLLRIFEIEAAQKGIKLKLHIGPSFVHLGELVEADPVRLSQITMNLISNSIKFTQSAKKKLIEVTINVSLVGPPTLESPPIFDPAHLDAPITQELVNGRHDGYIYVEVKDSGGGMTLEDQGHLFQRFKQGNAKVHTAVGGSGLGLFVCKEMTRLQGGRIDIVSKLDKGTSFRFFIQAGLFPPTHIPHSLNSPILPPPPPAPPAHRVPIASDAVLSILVVEDNPVNRKVLHRQFKRLLYHVEVAEHGLEALTKLREYALAGERFDAVLMDLEMPVMDGLSALREIRTLERSGILSGHQPCISVSGNARQGQLDAARLAGADACITKPYKFPLLVQKIKETIFHRRGIEEGGEEDREEWKPRERMMLEGEEWTPRVGEEVGGGEWGPEGESPRGGKGEEEKQLGLPPKEEEELEEEEEVGERPGVGVVTPGMDGVVVGNPFSPMHEEEPGRKGWLDGAVEEGMGKMGLGDGAGAAVGAAEGPDGFRDQVELGEVVGLGMRRGSDR